MSAIYPFQPPQLTPATWEGRKYFTTEASQCLQLAGLSSDESSVVGNEDCLYLNIHTTSQSSRSFSATVSSLTPAATASKTTQPTTAIDPLLTIANNPQDNAIDAGDGVNHGVAFTKTNRSQTPSAAASTSSAPRLKPVLVWLHGGSYNMGSATSDTNGTDYIVAKVCSTIPSVSSP